MKCPLLCLGKLAVGEITQDELSDCLKEECAWYDIGLGVCGIRVIGSALDVIRETLEAIEGKIPSVKL